MKLFLFVALLAFLATAYAWTKEDHEIFDLVSAVETSEGKGTTFYSWLDVSSTSTISQINKAYRKKSMQLHPDKNPNVKGIHDRFARLGVVATILRSPEGRERYDFFYKNGVPKWRGTGYYYSRFRPGLGTVFVFLALVSSGVQYLVHSITYKSDLQRVERFVREARSAAWGPKLIPIEGKRKVRVSLGGPARYDEDGNSLGRSVELVVEGNGDVYIVESDGELTPLDASAAQAPSIARTWVASWILSLIHKVTKRRSHGADAAEDGSESELDSDISGTPNSESSAATGSAPLKGRPVATSKAGGKRRKAVKAVKRK